MILRCDAMAKNKPIKLMENKKGITWSFIAKVIIWLVALLVLVYIIAKAAQNSTLILEKIKEIF